ncbi:MAG: GNAT family N-acetyltransferase [Acidobacteria bacterium]|nr:GNAT family N-acetyltransferase [Acidobacteriota bacterium]
MGVPLRVARGLELRPLKLADAPALFALVEANRAHLRRWLPWVDLNTDIAHTRAFIRLHQALEKRGEVRTYGLWWKRRLVGIAGLHSLDHENASGAVGYWLAADAEGHGLMSKAVGRLLDHAFGRLKLHRVELRAAVRNRRSRALAERLGFHHEGTARGAQALRGRFIDLAVYALRREGWRG